ncbi:hypothetical protein QH494_21305 [Sphingomonas sp. AR_OL41]|uniref:hypothetical protein n=1 Tax=Sphingomonas sp. AR_OL41 TaxID=3042729 RepID=UPI0024819504|nr:hypothetical protein [Sphingomonas sp. AR_OL41]MDH7974736.1 hypothetical protein [Sphingomonas sp. AR_OL41]
MRLLPLIAILLCSLGAAPGGNDADLSSLSHQLAQLRATQGSNAERDAGPELIPVKRALRSWVERQLPSRPPDSEDGSGNMLTEDDLAPLAAQMNASLDTAGLTCGREGMPGYRCNTPADASADFRGYLEHVTLGLLGGDRYLLLITGVGVSCGFDESAYVFEQRPDHAWHLLLSSERNDYARDHYKPEHLIAVNVAPSDVSWNEAAPPPLIATLGYSPWCSSNWHSLYARLWRASATTPTPILDREDELFMGGDFVAAARLTAGDLLVQYRGGSIDGGVLTRSHVLHYRIAAGDKLARIAPVALDPQAFVEEWLTSDWSQARRWNERRSDDAMLARLHPPAPRSAEDILFGDFDDSLRRCRADPSLWQVAVTLDPNGTAPHPPRYFMVRWMPPYRFTLVKAGYRAFAGCDEQVAAPDDVGTLFPLQGWRADAS